MSFRLWSESFSTPRRAAGKSKSGGDGSAQRDFLYVKDAARAAFLVMSKVEGAVNMGSGQIHSIRKVVNILSELTGMSRHVEWDASKPNGQTYRGYDLTKLNEIGFEPAYSLHAGLQETWDWYCEQNSLPEHRAAR